MQDSSVSVVLDGLFFNSDITLKLISVGGFFITGAAFLLALIYLGQYVLGNISVSGFTTLVILITGFFGILMMSISVLGLYILRILQQVTFSPQYTLRNYLPHPETTKSPK